MPSTMLSTHKKQESIRVVVVDDHYLIHEAIRSILAERKDIRLVAKGAVGDHVIPLVETYRPDVLILDLNMPQSEQPTEGANRFAILPTIVQISEEYPETAVIILTQHDFSAVIRKAVEYGVSGYILKSDDISLNLANAIDTVCQGGVYYSQTILQRLRQNQKGHPPASLTKRQIDVLSVTRRHPNASYRENAARLGIRESTFKTHLQGAFRALGAKNTTAAILQCLELGLLPPDK